MKQLYIPYVGNFPAPLNIKGHKLIFAAREAEVIEDGLDMLGADHLIEFVSESESDEVERISVLAEDCASGIVILPDKSPLEDVIRSLEQDLPWIH
jgi:hypothetical protein